MAAGGWIFHHKMGSGGILILTKKVYNRIF
jgi:hypothetical protein